MRERVGRAASRRGMAWDNGYSQASGFRHDEPSFWRVQRSVVAKIKGLLVR